MKTKIGTILDDKLFRKLKKYSVKENRSISEIIQDALTIYFQGDIKNRETKIQTVERMCSKPFNVSIEELKEIIEEEYYEQ